MIRFFQIIIISIMAALLSNSVSIADGIIVNSVERNSILEQDNITGDVNSDGAVNIFDLLQLLHHLTIGEDSPDADIDKNGVVEITDIVALLQKLVFDQSDSDNGDFEFVIIEESWRQVLGRKLSVTEWADCRDSTAELIPSKRNIKLLSNKNIKHFQLIFGDDTLDTPDDSIGPFLDPDTMNIQIPGFDEPFLTTGIPWNLHLEADNGSIIDTGGISEVIIWYCIELESTSAPYVSREIEFPIELTGEAQKFRMIASDGSREDTLIIDLNPERLKNVSIDKMDNLISALRTAISNALNNPARPEYLRKEINVGRARSTYTDKIADRLTFRQSSIFYLRIEPLDGNRELVKKIGFPEWFSGEYLCTDQEYIFSD